MQLIYTARRAAHIYNALLPWLPIDFAYLLIAYPKMYLQLRQIPLLSTRAFFFYFPWREHMYGEEEIRVNRIIHLLFQLYYIRCA